MEDLFSVARQENVRNISGHRRTSKRKPETIVSALFSFDEAQAQSVSGWIAGVDEAGRGPLAGPVVAAAVVIFRRTSLYHLNDSKQVTTSRREELYQEIVRNCLIGVGMADENQIDTLNIYHATRWAMRQAVLNLPMTPDFVLIDGNMRLDLPIEQKAVVKGDTQSASIAAASIIAKVYRDAYMARLEAQYPGYGFKKHKGYGTRLHLEKIRELGPSPVHRKSFAPVQSFLDEAPDQTFSQ